ncbi:HNH endonuclease [Bdellovibrio sp. SKB1291214]|uniref:HNH endonuclease n=1 Tax=Bdellovibrio sp. SKB1291214 TaxID=1732569 RepID=UPI00223EDC90|nr:HNH endonuclease signature motif containing protein [Bdellovibrio sp. SKB1291214]UYL08444.1 HNH endonuclease [Bdellovibrio sp. SKB1291214]
MILSALSNEELSGRLETLAHSERKITHLILIHINEMESRRLYAELGFDSMFRYLTRHLKYSEDAAYRRLSAARLLKKSPEIANRLENGSLNLTQLAQVQSALRQDAKFNLNDSTIASDGIPQILDKIENKSSFETKKTLTQEFKLPIAKHEVLEPQRDDSVRLEITLTTEQLKTLETARDLMSHLLPNGNWADFLTLLAEKQIQKILGKDVLETSKSETGKLLKPTSDIENDTKRSSLDVSCLTKVELVQESLPAKSSTHSFLAARKRGHIKATTKRGLLAAANYRCEYKNQNTGIKCDSKYQLQIDHIQPIALGGKDDKQNLRVLCRTHNLMVASQMGLPWRID